MYSYGVLVLHKCPLSTTKTHSDTNLQGVPQTITQAPPMSSDIMLSISNQNCLRNVTRIVQKSSEGTSTDHP